MNTFKENLKIPNFNGDIKKQLEDQFRNAETARYDMIFQAPEVQEYISNVIACIMLSHYTTYGHHTGVNMPHRIKANNSAKQKIESRIKEAKCDFTSDGKMQMTFEPITDYVACKMILRNAPPIRYSGDKKLQRLIEQCKEREQFLEEMQEIKSRFISNEYSYDNNYTYRYDYPQKEYYIKCREILEKLKSMTNPKSTEVLAEYDKKIEIINQRIVNIDAISAFAAAKNGQEDYERKVTEADFTDKDINFFSLLKEYSACMYDDRDLSILTNQFLSLFKKNPALNKLGVSISKIPIKEKRTAKGFTSNFVILNTLIGKIEIQLQTQHQYREGLTGRAAHSNMDGKNISPLVPPDFNSANDTQRFKDKIDYICPKFFHAKMDDKEANRVLVETYSDYQRYRGLLSEVPLDVSASPEVQEYWEGLYEGAKESKIFSTENGESQGFIPYDIDRYLKSDKFKHFKESASKFHFSDDLGNKVVITDNTPTPKLDEAERE